MFFVPVTDDGETAGLSIDLRPRDKCVRALEEFDA